MNTNPALVSQRNGITYIQNMLDAHQAWLPYIRGVHLHQSLSGVYVRRHTGALPEDFPIGDANAQFSYSYLHVLKIDRHQPWTDPAAARLIERIWPEYLTHELSAGSHKARVQAARRQIETLKKGGLSLCPREPPVSKFKI